MSASILIVDDNLSITTSTKKILELEGYNVSVAFNFQECLDRLKYKKFDLILLDIMLPDGSGRDLQREILKLNPHQKIIFFSAIPPSQDMLELQRKTGVNVNISKPFTKATLLDAVKKALES